MLGPLARPTALPMLWQSSHAVRRGVGHAARARRLASDGGVFPVGHGGQSPAAVKRLGTAERGHGKQFLITDFKKNIKNPHFSQNYSSNLAKQPKGFSFNRSEFSDVCNSIGASSNVMRPSDHTFNIIRSLNK